MITNTYIFAFFEGEGWTRVIYGVDGSPQHSFMCYDRLSDLLHDCGDCQTCIITL